jgi:integrase
VLGQQVSGPIREIKTAWYSALREAGIQGFRFHDLRHSFGTMAADGGAHPKDIKAILGHADIHTTMRYVHATDEGKRKAVEAAAKARRTNQSASHMPQKTKAS